VTATRPRLAGVLAVAVLGLAGCGGALATTGAQAELARTTPGASCADVVRRISNQLSDQVRLGLRHARVGKVTLAGGHASIRAGDITATQGTVKGFLQASAAPTKLTRQSDGSWKIAG
jgi:hypothetical protein